MTLVGVQSIYLNTRMLRIALLSLPSHFPPDIIVATCCVVQEDVDPELKRTVVVSTKFDTRIPQFATGKDAEAFLTPQQLAHLRMLGGTPFFTSVPSGRVGDPESAWQRFEHHWHA